MRTVFAILALAALVLTAQIRPAEAQASGPFCFSMQPFTDILVLFVAPNGGNQFIVTGRDLVTGSALSATIFITGNLAVLLGFALVSVIATAAVQGRRTR